MSGLGNNMTFTKHFLENPCSELSPLKFEYVLGMTVYVGPFNNIKLLN